MPEKRSRGMRAAVEGLERRETPSSHALAALPAAKVVNFGGNGAATVNLSEPVVNGQEVFTSLAGSSKTLGKFSGQLDVIYGLDLTRGSGTGVLTASNGDVLDLNVSAVSNAPVSPHGRPGAIHFTVTGGTGAFANAKGQGVISGNVSVLYNYKFHLQGRVRE